MSFDDEQPRKKSSRACPTKLTSFTYKVYNQLTVIKLVGLSKRALKELRKVPHHVTVKLQAWVEGVENDGLHEVQKMPGFHDEPLKGKRRGQRAIRLSRSYRAIYRIEKDTKNEEFVYVEEVTKHEY